MAKNRPSFDDYSASFLASLGFNNDKARAENTYAINMRSAKAAAQDSVFAFVVKAIRELPAKYLGGQPELLFYHEITDDLKIRVKPFESVINKAFRQNILYNKYWPNKLKKPENFYSDIDDLLRARLVCRYLDGPRFVCEKLQEICDAEGIKCHHRELSTDAGYYAWHFYFKVPVQILINNSPETRSMWVEIQLTTQLAEVITSLTHSLYEGRRVGDKGKDHWKWEAESPEFRSAFIGHGLHLLEGMIKSFRDDVLTPKKPAEPAAATEPVIDAVDEKAPEAVPGIEVDQSGAAQQ